MKALLLLLSLSCLSGALSAQNRIASAADRAIYGEYITPGDLIIDQPTREKSGKRDVIYYFMPRQWPALREGATIWIDGGKLGPVDEIKFCNTSNTLEPWHIESATVRNIPHTRVVTGAFVCHGLKNFTLDGESAAYPGLASWPESRKFLTGSFGFHVINERGGGHGYSVDVRDGGTIRMNGFEVQHGFSGVRTTGGNYDIVIESIELSNFYIHDTRTGEGQYLGATHKPPFAKIKNLKVYNGIIARTAAEALQFQHLAGGADIHHVTIYAADSKWMNAFMAGQDTGIQWSVAGGENRIHHIVVDGFGSMGLVPFGSGDRPTAGVSKVSNILFNDGRDTGMYLHKSTSYGIRWVFDSLYFRGYTATYYAETGRRERNFYISEKRGSDPFVFRNIFHDGTKPKVFEDTAGITVDLATVYEQNLPAPHYVNSGFHEPAHRIKQWHAHYGKYFPASRRDTVRMQKPTQWDAGDIAIETKGTYRFYKCIKTHAADGRRPGEHPWFKALTWDANGVRSDQPDWDASVAQSDFPPDDLRLKPGNYWKRLGIGFQEARVPEPHVASGK